MRHEPVDPSGRSWRSPRQLSRSAHSSITTGLVFTAGFGIAWAVTGLWFLVFPMVFAGVLPLVRGLLRLPASRDREKHTELSRTVAREKQVLQAARDERGIITPTVVALKTDLSIHDAEQMLEDMARKGHALMRVTESGRVEYEFPEFLPRLDG
jgi:hypothetical protein